jgi:parvulin-like peptidyl-prolyl isomerase
MKTTKILWIAVPVAFILAIVLTLFGPAPEIKPEVKLRQLATVAQTDDPEDVKRARDKAEDILDHLDKGEDFAELAEQNSETLGASTAGDIGWIGQGLLPSNLEDIAFSLEKGGHSDIIEEKRDDGRIVFRILYVEDRRNF